MPTHICRRRFLQTAAVTGTALFRTHLLEAADKRLPPSDRLQVGVIGTTNQAAYDLNEVNAGGADIAALCDVDEPRAAGMRGRFPRAAFFTDYRRLIDHKGLDAVVVATPDHHHALATLAALRAGLHVYCEKPLTHTVAEARLVAQTTARARRVTQMGTQIHAGSNYRRVVELVQAGALGPVREVHVWVSTRWGGGDRPKGSEPIPEGLHWDLWLGPAPKRPYYHGPDKKGFGIYHPYNWRRWWDFGGGALADMACHYMDLPFWALKLRHPSAVAAEGSPVHPETAALWLSVRYEFPARGDLPPVKLTWYDGGKQPPLVEQGQVPRWGNGVLFVGEKGMLIADYGQHRLLHEKQYEGFVPPRPTIRDSIGHHREWVQACKSGGPTT